MSDLSDSAAEEAELQAREAFRGLARTADKRYDLTDAELCWEKDRSRDGEADDGGTMAGCLGGGGGHRVAWFGGDSSLLGGWESRDMPLGLRCRGWAGRKLVVGVSGLRRAGTLVWQSASYPAGLKAEQGMKWVRRIDGVNAALAGWVAFR